MTIIKEFIDALAIEIDALKKGKGGSIVTVYNGELIRQTLDLFIYQFTLENFLVAFDDTPANIEVNGKEYDCDIISITGQQVQIAIKQKLADRIPVAKIKTNTWYLLERLRKKYEDNLSTQSRFENSNKLFQDDRSKIDGGNFNTSYSINGKAPNPYQHKAVESSINDFLSIIWGPPGTGKTQTIAKAIESHLNLDRKVLLLSHSNNAVDQALLKVAGQMKKTYYKEGQLVRLGTPKPEMSEKYEKEDCPLVMIDKIAEFKSKELVIEKQELNAQFEKIKISKQSYENIIDLNLEISRVNSQLEKEASEIKTIESKTGSAKTELSQIQNQIIELQEKLLKAQNSGFLKRTFLGLDPVKIETNLKNANSTLTVKTNQLKNLEEQLRYLNQNILPLKTAKSKNEAELSKQLSKVGKSLSEVQKEVNEFDNKVKHLQIRLDEINKALEEIKIQVLKDAKLVATTLTKSYIAKEIENIDFDILLVDEVSMAPMPMLYWAASKIKKGITIVGDFKQLPPICVADDELAKKWLGRSIFDELNISEISQAEKRVQPLYIQYRMHPHISEIVNKRVYDNRLEDHESVKSKNKADSVAGNSAVCLIDTSVHNPWCSQLETGGRFNLISALICVALAEKISKSFGQNESIGIITPYRSQARLILKIAEDKGILKSTKIRINTVHSFQGGEETAIIFDSVEGEGAKKWSMINEYNNTESAKLLLNVALTRAETKLYVVANCNYIKNTFESNTLFMDVLRHIIAKGKENSSTEIIADLRDENFEYWASKLNSLEDRPENIGSNYDDIDFWVAFHNDLAKANSELIIFSPYLTSDRLGKLHLKFSQLLSKGIRISVITLSPNDRLQLKGATEVVSKLKAMNITVKFRDGMHEKIAIVDRKIEWSGSLNILSHNSRKEYMKRFEGENTVKELFQRFDLDELLYSPNLNGEICPKCGTNFIRPKNHYGKSFYGCSGYPDCDFTADIRIKTLDELEKKKSKQKSYPPKPKPSAKQNQKSQTTETITDLFGNETPGRQWESAKLFWSSVELPGYKYSKKKNAWWKAK
ncbi:MAG: AAA family ATPase [Bacteroidetes bacterium]|nr:AAA family ATPase [Bacteroidota bacterium]